MVIISFEVDIVIGLGVMVALALLLSFISFDKFNPKVFLMFLSLTSGYMLYADLIPLWVLIFCLIILIILITMDINEKRKGSNS